MNKRGSYFRSTDDKAPMTAGVYRLGAGTSTTTDYAHHEMRVIIAGDFNVMDETGKEASAKAGDVLYFPRGSKITLSTVNGGHGFFVCVPSS